ncbi:hypothetical protein T02_11955 [Trichinella nativa]|uniref:PiggyBac transposable element-derived protein domain-containing protein n=1 Tax=Trichinella nativa TaxID=6335 RepID=A0A0V1KV46_9BILA|nr:hypothetical protein T02_11955 [Trichinella nativa]
MLAEVVKNVKLVLQAPMLGNWHSQCVNSNKNVWTHGLTSVGTISAYRRDVPACLRKAARRDPYSTLAVYEQNRKVTMINYVPRKNSNNLLLTSCHAKLKVDNQRDDKRPNIMNDYNLGKRGVDSMDARIEDFFCKKCQQIHHADFVLHC